MPIRIERLAERGHMLHAEAAETDKHLAPHELDSREQVRTLRVSLRSRDRAIEVVHDGEEAREQLASALFELLRGCVLDSSLRGFDFCMRLIGARIGGGKLLVFLCDKRVQLLDLAFEDR